MGFFDRIFSRIVSGPPDVQIANLTQLVYTRWVQPLEGATAQERQRVLIGIGSENIDDWLEKEGLLPTNIITVIFHISLKQMRDIGQVDLDLLAKATDPWEEMKPWVEWASFADLLHDGDLGPQDWVPEPHVHAAVSWSQVKGDPSEQPRFIPLYEGLPLPPFIVDDKWKLAVYEFDPANKTYKWILRLYLPAGVVTDRSTAERWYLTFGELLSAGLQVSGWGKLKPEDIATFRPAGPSPLMVMSRNQGEDFLEIEITHSKTYGRPLEMTVRSSAWGRYRPEELAKPLRERIHTPVLVRTGKER